MTLGQDQEKTLTSHIFINSISCLDLPTFRSQAAMVSEIDKTNINNYYNSYILPLFDYGCMIWGRTTTTNINRLVKLQKRAARIILNADFMTPSENMFKELNWLTFSNRVTFYICIMMYLRNTFIFDVFMDYEHIGSRAK